MEVVIVIAEYIRQLNAIGYAESTIDGYQRNLRYFKQYLQTIDINDLRKVTHKIILNYQAGIMAEPNAMETKALKIRPVKRLFEYLVESNRLLINPTEGIVETTRVNRKIQPVLTIEEIRLLLEQPNLSLKTGIRDRALIEVMYCTGIRINELLSLTVYEPDMKDQILYIRKGKGKRQRVVPLSRTACHYLKEYMIHIRPYYAKRNPKERVLFLTVSAYQMTPGAVTQILRKYRITAGIKKNVTGHTIRRSCATHMLQNGADIRYIQKLLGHQHVSTTQFYTKVMPVDIKKTHRQTHPGLKSEISRKMQ